MGSVEGFCVCPTFKPLSIFYLLVSITNVLLRRAALHQLQAFVIVLLKVIYANLNVPPRYSRHCHLPHRVANGFCLQIKKVSKVSVN